MPLVMMCGFPGSGKSTRTLELFGHLKNLGREVVIINEESLNIDRTEGYKDSTKEKLTRGSIKAATERSVTKDVTVIVDSLNYIKGYRYELYCLSRAASTPHMVIFCDSPKEDVLAWNESRTEGKWDATMMTELMMRFETPNPKQRWDDPCYLIRPGDVLPVEEMAGLLASTKTESTTFATQYSKVSDTNYVFDMEKASQEAIAAILEASNSSMVGDTVSIPGATKKVVLLKLVNMAELRRLRRQYLTLTRQMANTQTAYTQQTAQDAVNGFVDYVNTQLAL